MSTQRIPVGDVPQMWPEQRLCDGNTDMFFPDRLTPRHTETARRTCGACPALRRCAAWAQTVPLTDCVVAGVLMPTLGGRRQKALAALAAVVAASTDESQGGAAWTAA